MQRTTQRFHQHLPTLEESRINTNAIYSDHLPLLGTVDNMIDYGSYKFVTFNVLNAAKNTAHGFASGLDAILEPNGPRKQRIINAIKIIIAKQNPVAIFLQETWVELDEALAVELRKMNWQLVQDENGMPILINNRIFKYDENYKLTQIDPTRSWSTKKLVVTTCKDNMRVALVNLHWLHLDVPTGRAENILNNLLDLNNREEPIMILAGDTNQRIVHPGKRYQVNNVVPPMFRKRFRDDEERQRADSTDVIYYSDGNGKCSQVSFFSLNPATGETTDSHESIIDHNHLPQDQINELLRAHLPLTLQADIKIASEQTQKYFPAWLVTAARHCGLEFRFAYNSYGEKFAAIAGEVSTADFALNAKRRAFIEEFAQFARRDNLAIGYPNGTEDRREGFVGGKGGYFIVFHNIPIFDLNNGQKPSPTENYNALKNRLISIYTPPFNWKKFALGLGIALGIATLAAAAAIFLVFGGPAAAAVITAGVGVFMSTGVTSSATATALTFAGFIIGATAACSGLLLGLGFVAGKVLNVISNAIKRRHNHHKIEDAGLGVRNASTDLLLANSMKGSSDFEQQLSFANSEELDTAASASAPDESESSEDTLSTSAGSAYRRLRLVGANSAAVSSNADVINTQAQHQP